MIKVVKNKTNCPSVIPSTSVIPVQTGIYTNNMDPRVREDDNTIESGMTNGSAGMTNCVPSFTVSITDPVARDIKFNYWLIQSKP